VHGNMGAKALTAGSAPGPDTAFRRVWTMASPAGRWRPCDLPGTVQPTTWP
jgi:hypothetical protein